MVLRLLDVWHLLYFRNDIYSKLSPLWKKTEVSRMKPTIDEKMRNCTDCDHVRYWHKEDGCHAAQGYRSEGCTCKHFKEVHQ